jgi:hypothetical protein
MNNRSEQLEVLHDVMAESSPPDFRAALLAETLRQARRRRRWRQGRVVAGVLGLLVCATWLGWHRLPPEIAVARPPEKVATAKSFELVETQPLPPNAMVTTKEFGRVRMILSGATVATVATGSGGFRFINDSQLLALVGPKPAILIRTGPDSEELVFAGAVESSSVGAGN